MIFDVKQLEQFPTQPGVYLMKDAAGNVLYVGKAKLLKNRLKQYFLPGGDSRPMVPVLIRQIATIDTLVVPSEKEALLLENTLIKKHQPKFNALLKDDKTFISLMINSHHPWPRIQLVRSKATSSKKADGLYFGPYTSAYAARQTYELLTTLFPLRQCSDEELKRRTRPCLLYAIKRCIAPCVGKCTQEEYASCVDGAIKFLKGQDKAVLKGLYEKMHAAAENLEYERAAALLQSIRQIEHVVQAENLLVKANGKSCDALGAYRQAEEVMLIQLLFREGKLTGSRSYSFSNILEEDEALLSSFILQHYAHRQEEPPEEILLPIPLQNAGLISEILFDFHKKKITLQHPKKGDKRALVEIALQNAQADFKKTKHSEERTEKMLLDLQETLKLNCYPKRIECFDTSNIAGTDPVASLVAFTNAQQDKKRTRLFKIKTAPKSDDYGAMKEVLLRHLTRAKTTDDLPDLIIVDGGKGHLTTACDVFKELDIASVDVIALAKEKGRHDKGMTAEQVFLPEHHDPISLNPRSNLLFLLQKIRDEAHRTAIRFHRKRRTKRTLTSALDTLPGIGAIKRARLLRHFGSVEQVQKASEEELRQVKGLTKKDVEMLLALRKGE